VIPRSPQEALAIEREGLRLSATLLFVGLVLIFVVGIFHADPNRGSANDHLAAFAVYAGSASWTAVHVGQFAGMAVVVAGLLVLSFALNVQTVPSAWICRLGAVAAVLALALYGVLQAVDGVALKQAVNAWVNAPPADRATRFASAEAIRWLEWGVRSYHSLVLGVSFVMFGWVIVRIGTPHRAIGYLMASSGLAYLVQGWVIGTEGFSASNTAPTLGAYVTWLVWSVWLVVVAWRMK
jgi:hypothetical protein